MGCSVLCGAGVVEVEEQRALPTQLIDKVPFRCLWKAGSNNSEWCITQSMLSLY